MPVSASHRGKLTPEPAWRKAVEQKIERIVQQELQKNAGKTGQVADVSA